MKHLFVALLFVTFSVFAQESTPPQGAVAPKVHFDAAAWVLINADSVQQIEFWLKKSEIECDREYCAPVGMIKFTGETKSVDGVGQKVGKIYSESIVDCNRQLLYPIRDVYTQTDETVIKEFKHPKSALPLPTTEEGTMMYAAFQLVCKGKVVKIPGKI